MHSSSLVSLIEMLSQHCPLITTDAETSSHILRAKFGASPQPSPPVLSIQDVEALIDRKTKRPKSSQSSALAMMTTGKVMTLASLLADAISAVTCGNQMGVMKPL